MTSPSGSWRPSPELLAAYFDGECEGRDDLADLKQRIEHWLTANPDAQQELADHRRLLHVWRQTSPPEPSPDRWATMFAHLQTQVSWERLPSPSMPPRRQFPRLRSAALAISAAAAVAFVLVYFGSNRPAENAQPIVQVKKEATTPSHQQPNEDDEILPVANAQEVSIVRVEGADTQTLVVGELPLQGNLELVAPGDVILTLVRPGANTKTVQPVRFIQSSSPMIWAKTESEQD